MTINQAFTRLTDKILAGTSIGAGAGTPLVAPLEKWWIGYAISALACLALCVSKWYDARIKKHKLDLDRKESEFRMRNMAREED